MSQWNRQGRSVPRCRRKTGWAISLEIWKCWPVLDNSIDNASHQWFIQSNPEHLWYSLEIVLWQGQDHGVSSGWGTAQFQFFPEIRHAPAVCSTGVPWSHLRLWTTLGVSQCYPNFPNPLESQRQSIHTCIFCTCDLGFVQKCPEVSLTSPWLPPLHTPLTAMRPGSSSGSMSPPNTIQWSRYQLLLTNSISSSALFIRDLDYDTERMCINFIDDKARRNG